MDDRLGFIFIRKERLNRSWHNHMVEYKMSGKVVLVGRHCDELPKLPEDMKDNVYGVHMPDRMAEEVTPYEQHQRFPDEIKCFTLLT